LPWEWRDYYRLRSIIYPSYLSLPLWFLKIFGLDYGYLVRISPNFAHILLVIISDSYLWKIGKLTVGKNASRFAFYILFFARIYNELIIRTFSNSVETIFQVIAFYYFLKVSNKFDKNLVILTFLLTMSFMIRSTSPIGWPPLIIIKILKDRSLLPFIYAFVLVFIPVVFLTVAIDSYYYGEFPVITSINFMRVNVAEGLSKYFGKDPFDFYVYRTLPQFFTVVIPAVYFGYYSYLKDKLTISKDQVPYLAILSLSYLIIFSLIAHKEDRFMLPIIPFSALLGAYAFKNCTKALI
jgi:GPI mannosyltransferase 3